MIVSNIPRRLLSALCLMVFVFGATVPLVAATLKVPQDYSTIVRALGHAKKGDTVLVADGEYAGRIKLSSGITLVALHTHGATIDGRSAKTTVTLKTGSSISGFIVTGGRIGIYAEGADISIRGCKIQGNLLSGISCVGLLPSISDNLIVHNAGSGIQGWDARMAASSINHNTIAFNGNHGIALGGNSDITAENNIIANNTQYGCKADPSTKLNLRNNCFFMNVDLMAAQPEGSISLDPRFTAPAAYNFRLGEDSGCRNAAGDGSDLGARIFDTGN